MKTTVQNLYQNAGELAGSRVTVSGWVRTVRESKALGFIELHDGTYMKSLQVVFERAKLEEGGELWQKTDNEDFFNYSLASFSECGWQVSDICRDLAAFPIEGNVITEHEQKFMDEGRRIFRLVARPLCRGAAKTFNESPQ